MKVSFFLAVFLLLSKNILAYESPRYEIKATLDVQNKVIKAHQKVTVVNNSDKSWPEIYFHVYPNREYTSAEKKSLMKYAGFFKVNPFPEGFQRPKMNIYSINQADQTLTYSLEGQDKTILKVTLSQELLPGQTVDIDLDFSVTIPHAYGRFGWHDGVFAIFRDQ